MCLIIQINLARMNIKKLDHFLNNGKLLNVRRKNTFLGRPHSANSKAYRQGEPWQGIVFRKYKIFFDPKKFFLGSGIMFFPLGTDRRSRSLKKIPWKKQGEINYLFALPKKSLDCRQFIKWLRLKIETNF